MGEVVFVMGRTGSGKSYSLRNLDHAGVFSVGGKRMPFPGGPKTVSLGSLPYQQRYEKIERTLRKNNSRCYVVDDSSFLQADENLERAFEGGDAFKKYLEIGVHFARLVETAMGTSEDTVVYFLHHLDTDDFGRDEVRSIGKLVKEKYNPIERCNVVISCVNEAGEHKFRTKNDGANLAKSPPGMLPDEMENDLARADDLIRAFYHMAPRAAEEKEGA